MSGFINAASSALAGLTSWRNNLRPASFRGVPFYMDEASGSGGRRHVIHEFPLRDIPFPEDLGRSANKYRVKAWVVGDNYLQASRDLIAACQDHDDAAIFVHAWRGPIRCRAGVIAWRDDKDHGGYCAIDIDFVVDPGGLPSPTARVDTSSRLLAGVASLAKLALVAYQEVSLIIQHPALLLGVAASLLGGVAGAILGLPSAITTGLIGLVASIALAPGDDTATGIAVQTVFQAAAAAVITAQQTATDAASGTGDPILGQLPMLAPSADLSGGLAALTTWGNALPIPADPIAAAQQAAILALVQGAAVAAVLTVYASIDFPSSQAATAARDQVRTMIDAQLDLTAELGQDDLYRGWQAISAQATEDLITRAQALPDLTAYTTLASLPSLVLAYDWYQDADRADEIAALNDVADPMFMPFAGVRLSA